MLVFRPVADGDAVRLLQLARQASFGLTTLPPDAAVLRQRVARAVHDFADPTVTGRGRSYLFVVEDTETGLVQAVSGIADKIGGFQPWWTYRLDVHAVTSTEFGVDRCLQILQLESVHDGPSEIGSLFCSPAFRGHGAGRLASLARFMVMAAHPQRFEKEVIAEMRGVVDDSGHSPFWEALGRHFFAMDFPEADYVSLSNKQFVAELMPRHPIYVCLLPATAQQVIGRVHANTRPALELLMQQGFRTTGQIDPFEAGPVMGCAVQDIEVVRASCHTSARSVQTSAINSTADMCLLANTSWPPRVVSTRVVLESDSVSLSEPAMRCLQLEAGDPVVVSPLRSSH